MYLEMQELSRLLRDLAAWLVHRENRLWMDHVIPELLLSTEPGPRQFLTDMARLGEPFINGFHSVNQLSTPWTAEHVSSAAGVLGTADPVDAGYRFVIARSGGTA